MYYPFFIIYILLGFAITLPFIFWALKNGQFEQQQRARFLPLEKEPQTPVETLSRISTYEFYALCVLVSLGLLSSAAVLIFSLLFL